MGLLEEIRDGAVDARSDMGELIRKCLRLAFDLNNEELKVWAQKELNGYTKDDDLPPYRVVSASSMGYFSGRFGQSAKNAPVPLLPLPEDFRELLSKLRFREPIATYDTLARERKDDASLKQPWAPDVVAAFGQAFSDDWVLLDAWQPFPVGVMRSIVERVRGKVLGFVLQLAREAPASQGDASRISEELPPDRVTQIFQTTIYADGSNIAVGSSNFRQKATATVRIVKGDLGSLKRHLISEGLEASDIDDLEKAIRSDPTPTAKGKFGSRVAAWMGKMVAKAASGGWDITAGAAGNLLAEALWTYYGFGG